MINIRKEYMAQVFHVDLLYKIDEDVMYALEWKRVKGQDTKYYPTFCAGGKYIDMVNADPNLYILFPRINEGYMLRNVPDWGCFNAEALRRSGIDFLKYADSEPYIYVNPELDEENQAFWDIAFHMADVTRFLDYQPMAAKRVFYAHMNSCFDELAKQWCMEHDISVDEAAFIWGPQSEDIAYEQCKDEVQIDDLNVRYICGNSQVFHDDMLYDIKSGELYVPEWSTDESEDGEMYVSFYRYGKRIERSEIDGIKYMLLPVINLGRILSELPDWGCFDADALKRSNIDCSKYADSEPYLYIDMTLPLSRQPYVPIQQYAIRAMIFADCQPDNARKEFYRHLDVCFNKLRVQWCNEHDFHRVVQ